MPCGSAANNSFKPNLLRYTNNVAEKACHVVASATQVGLTQALAPFIAASIAASRFILCNARSAAFSRLRWSRIHL